MKALIVLASRRTQGATPVHHIAEGERLPEKFLQSILLELKHAGIVESVRGAKGGYELCRDPFHLPLGEVIRLIDGPQAPLKDADGPDHTLGGRNNQALQEVFRRIHDASARILETTTLADLIDEPMNRA